MQRLALNIAVSAAAILAGAIAIMRGEGMIGVCLIGLGVLRALVTFATRKPPKAEPEIKLNLDDSGGDVRRS